MKHIRKYNESNSSVWTEEEINDIDEMFLSVKDECHLSKHDSIDDRRQYNIKTFDDKVLIIIKTCGEISYEYTSYEFSKDRRLDNQAYSDVENNIKDFISQLKTIGYTVNVKKLTKKFEMPLIRSKSTSDHFARCGIRIEITK